MYNVHCTYNNISYAYIIYSAHTYESVYTLTHTRLLLLACACGNLCAILNQDGDNDKAFQQQHLVCSCLVLLQLFLLFLLSLLLLLLLIFLSVAFLPFCFMANELALPTSLWSVATRIEVPLKLSVCSLLYTQLTDPIAEQLLKSIQIWPLIIGLQKYQTKSRNQNNETISYHAYTIWYHVRQFYLYVCLNVCTYVACMGIIIPLSVHCKTKTLISTMTQLQFQSRFHSHF